MAKKNVNKSSGSGVEKLINAPESFKIPYEVGGEQFDITVKSRLGLDESIKFVYAVVGAVVDEDESNISYAVKDFSTKINALSMFTNIPIPDDLKVQFDLVYGTDILDTILNASSFDVRSYNILLDSIDKQIAYEERKMQNQFKVQMESYVEQIKSEAEEVIGVFGKFGEAFSKVDPEQTAKLVANLAKIKNLDQNKLAEALIKERKDLELIK